MMRTKYANGLKSSVIVSEVKKKPCLFDTSDPNYGDRAEKIRCWEEVCECVVPCWSSLGLAEKVAAVKEVQKRWRSIRDSYTKAYRQGKCVIPEQCTAGSRRHQYNRQMSFLLRALQNKKPRYTQDKYESFSEVSTSPQHPPPEDIPKHELFDKPLDLKIKPVLDKPDTLDQGCQATMEDLGEVRTDSSTPPDEQNEDKLFMDSLLPSFRKMDDDTRLFCRTVFSNIIRYALQGHKSFEALKSSNDHVCRSHVSAMLREEAEGAREGRLSMTTRSADGSRPVRKRKSRSPSPLPTPPKRRGPGRPRKIRPPPSDSDEEQVTKKRSQKAPKLKSISDTPLVSEALRTDARGASDSLSYLEETLSRATSVTQLSTPLFMKMYNLSRSKDAPLLPSPPPSQHAM